MPVRRYLRPLAFSYGIDARRAIDTGTAGALGGINRIAFSQVEVIERGETTKRTVTTFRDMQRECSSITDARAPFAGLPLQQTLLMGIANVTPDSFSDGGKLADTAAAIAHGEQMLADGADLIDVGGESTRPGSDPVSQEEEARRIIPVIESLTKRCVVSADTRKPEIMVRAARSGAKVINDVSGLTFDNQSAKTIAGLGLPVVIMHAQGEPKTMQLSPKYDDVVLDVYDVLGERIELAVAAGISRSKIMVDPGIGFGKTYGHNLQVMQSLAVYHGLGVPLLFGASRKAFIGALTGENVAANRVIGSASAALHASLMGAHVIRVHDVKQTKQSLSVFWAAMDPDSADV